jgi:DNA-binding NarL/FixJ family response regulator
MLNYCYLKMSTFDDANNCGGRSPCSAECICRLLDGQSDMMMVGAAANGHEALALLNDGLHAHILLTDLTMPGMNGMELTRRAMAIHTDLRVIVLTLHTKSTVLQGVLSRDLDVNGCPLTFYR